MLEIVSLTEIDRLNVVEVTSPAASALAFVTDGAVTLAPSFSLSVTLTGNDHWEGEFFGGTDGYSAVILGVSGCSLLAVAGGVGYLVPIERPNEFRVIRPRPIRSVRVARDYGVVVLVGYTNLVALGAAGESWESERLAWDGFDEVRIGSGCVVVRGFHAPSDRDVEVTLDLQSGEVILRQ